MDADLLAFGIDLTHELDRRFGLEPKISMSQVGRPPSPPGEHALAGQRYDTTTFLAGCTGSSTATVHATALN